MVRLPPLAGTYFISVPDTQSLLLLVDLTALLTVRLLVPDSVLLFLLLKYPPKLGDQRGCAPYVLLPDHPQQIFRIHIAMGSRLHQVFQPLLPVSTDAISEIIDLTKLVFRIGIAVIRCHMEATDGLLHILPAFFIEVNFPGNISCRSDTRFRELSLIHISEPTRRS